MADGRIHRSALKGTRAGIRNGWCVLYADPIGHGAFGSWRTGESTPGGPNPKTTMTPAELAEQRRQFEAMRRQRGGERPVVREEARGKAARLWT